LHNVVYTFFAYCNKNCIRAREGAVRQKDLWICSEFFDSLDLFCRMPLARDFLHPSPIEEKRKHKLKRLVQKPNSYFMDVKCPGCYAIKTIFSHAQRPVECDGCRTILCTPTGGKARLTEGCSFRRKVQC